MSHQTNDPIHILLVDDAAAGHVQNDSVVLHLSDGLGVEQVAGLVVQRHMDGHIVRDLQDLLNAHALGVLLLKHMGGQIGVIGDDVHLKDAGQLTHALADAAKAQNAQRSSRLERLTRDLTKIQLKVGECAPHLVGGHSI